MDTLTNIAAELRSPSDQRTSVPVKTTGDLLELLAEKPQRPFSMLKSTCGLLGVYLDLPGNEIPIHILDARRKGFRPFLASRTYTENSVRSYVYQLRVLLKTARRFGWQLDAHAPERWRPLLTVASEKKITDIVRYFSRVAKTPADVTAEDVEHWCSEMTRDGMLFTTVAVKRNAFWRLLRDTSWTTYNPPYLIKQNKYGIALDQLAPEIQSEIDGAVEWKTSERSKGRPKWGKVRAVTAHGLRLVFSQVAGFAINVYGTQPTSLVDLITKDIIGGFVDWATNERGQPRVRPGISAESPSTRLLQP